MLETKNNLESAFFSLSSAIRTGSARVAKEDETSLDLDTEAIVEIIQCSSVGVFIVAILATCYKLRAKANRLIHRVYPKSAYPPSAPPNHMEQFKPNDHYGRFQYAGGPETQIPYSVAMTRMPSSHGNLSSFESSQQALKSVFKPDVAVEHRGN